MKLRTLFFAPLLIATGAHAQPAQTAASIQQPPSSLAGAPADSTFDQALILNGTAAEWLATANGDDFTKLKSAIDKYIAADGTITAPTTPAHTLDDIQLARAILLLYRTTQEKKYALAAQSLHNQLASQPRTAHGLYAHDQSDPHQVWLSDAFTVEPFRAAYAATFQQQDFNDIATQLLLLDTQLRDPKSGLLHSALDESKSAPWADQTTGLSPEVLAQPVALYAAALVDVLDWFPRDHPQRAALIAALHRTLTAVLKLQDPTTGLWWQSLNRAPHRAPELHRQPDGSIRFSLTHANQEIVLDPSASSLFAYAIAKGTRLGYLPPSDQATAQHAWNGIQNKFPATSSSDVFLLARSEIDQLTPALSAPASASAQSPTPARTGLLPSSKDFHAPTPETPSHRVNVMVDAWFNSQTRINALGQTELFHYKWDDDAFSGYSIFGRAFQRHQADLATLPEAPTRANLAPTHVYIIASPDIPTKNPNPHYMDQSSGDAIEAWVRSGGVLILFSNDRDNTEFTHFNTLSDRFGIHFNAVLSHHVIEPDHSTGEVVIPPGTGIFDTGFTAYMKDTSTITATGPAQAVVTDHGDVMIALAHLGKGTVLGIVDPWFYNEYADGRKMRQYHGYEAAGDVAAWAVHQAQSVKGAKQ